MEKVTRASIIRQMIEEGKSREDVIQFLLKADNGVKPIKGKNDEEKKRFAGLIFDKINKKKSPAPAPEAVEPDEPVEEDRVVVPE